MKHSAEEIIARIKRAHQDRHKQPKANGRDSEAKICIQIDDFAVMPAARPAMIAEAVAKMLSAQNASTSPIPALNSKMKD
jgi:hypothetical protein